MTEYTKLWSVEDVPTGGYVGYDNYETLEAATDSARAKAWSTGKSKFVMGPIAVAEAPEEVNEVKVTKL